MWSLIIPISAAILLAVALCAIFKRPILAAAIAAALSAISLQIWVRIELGYWDKFMPIALATSFLYFLAAAFAVLFAWRCFVKRRKA